MVFDADQALVGAAFVGVRAGVDGALCDYPRIVRICGVSLLEEANPVPGLSSVRGEYRLQSRVLADSIRIAEQSPRGGRYRACTQYTCLGDGFDMAARPVGRAREHSVPAVGLFRDDAPAHYHLA